MRSLAGIAFGAGLLLALPVATAQTGGDPPATPLAAQRRLTFFASGGRLQFYIASGDRVSKQESDEAGVQEQLRIWGDREFFTVNYRYELAWDEQEVVCEVNRAELHVSRQGGGAERPDFEFRQADALRLSVAEDDQRRLYVADDLWQLALIAGTDFDRTVAAATAILRPRWRLDREARAIRSQMLESARGAELPNISRWDELIAELASPRFAVRRAAERELIAQGGALAPYLNQVEVTSLDAEQRRRLANVQAALRPERFDAPARVAAAHLADAAAWIGVARGARGDDRRLALDAVNHLSPGTASLEQLIDADRTDAAWESLLSRCHPVARIETEAD